MATPPRVEYHATCTSTNDLLKKRAERNADDTDGLIIYCDQQLQGRGRRGNNWWLGPPTENLAFSIAITNPPRPFESLSVLASTCLAKALQKILRKNVVIKWPNDILIDKKKIAGVLAELVHDKKNKTSAIIGIGLNIRSSPPKKMTRYPTTHCAEWTNQPPSRQKVIEQWWLSWTIAKKHLNETGPKSLEEEYLKHLSAWGTNGLYHPVLGKLGRPLDFSFNQGLKCTHYSSSIPITTLDGLEAINY